MPTFTESYLDLNDCLSEKEIEKKNSQKIWRGNSDTEVLCESIELFGLEKTLEMCDGMFAFGVYDKKRKRKTKNEKRNRL